MTRWTQRRSCRWLRRQPGSKTISGRPGCSAALIVIEAHSPASYTGKSVLCRSWPQPFRRVLIPAPEQHPLDALQLRPLLNFGTQVQRGSCAGGVVLRTWQTAGPHKSG